MSKHPFSLEEWTMAHPRWQELVHLMEAEEQAYYWQEESEATTVSERGASDSSLRSE